MSREMCSVTTIGPSKAKKGNYRLTTSIESAAQLRRFIDMKAKVTSLEKAVELIGARSGG
jgi:hypothetical protein